jgi:transcription initiation factor TFIIIB Brf1 subunit/transcription initiation factor TFIIB
MRMAAVVDILDRLFKIARSIRNPATRSAQSRRNVYSTLDAEYRDQLVNSLVNLEVLRIQDIIHDWRKDIRDQTPIQTPQTADKTDKVRNDAYQQIETWADRANLNHSVKLTAKAYYKRVDDAKAFKDEGLDVVLAGCLFIACLQCKTPRSFTEIFGLTSVPKKEIGAAYKQLDKFLTNNTNANMKVIEDDGDPVVAPNLMMPDNYQTPRHASPLDETDEVLCRQLGKANSWRRQQFMYWRRRHERSTANASSQPVFQEEDLKAVKLPDIPKDPALPLPVRANPLQSMPSSVTKLRPGQIDFNESKSVASNITRVPSAKGPSGEKAAWPPYPDGLAPDDFFTCPYCFNLCPKRYLNSQGWKYAQYGSYHVYSYG